MAKLPEQQRRVAVLRREVTAVGGAASFARLHKEVDPTYVSQLLTGHRSFGEKAARRMEQRCGWPAGYLDDADADERPTSVSLSAQQAELLRTWQHLTDKQRAALLEQIQAEAASNIEIAQHLKDMRGGGIVPDATVAKALPRRPDRVRVKPK